MERRRQRLPFSTLRRTSWLISVTAAAILLLPGQRAVGETSMVARSGSSVDLLPAVPPPQPPENNALVECSSCRAFCRVQRRMATGRKPSLLEAGEERVFESGCAKACRQEPSCPFMVDRMAPTPYPPPPPPPRPHPLWAGDFRAKGLVMGMPTPTPPGPPPPPLPPLPVVPIPNWKEKIVGLRFLPRLEMPKGEVNENQDLDYNGNPVSRAPPSLLSTSHLVSFGQEDDDSY